MKGWALWILAAAVLTPAGRAQTATEILQKVAAAYRGGAPLDIEWVEGFEHQSQALTSATQSHIRMVQSGTKARLEQGGMLYVSDGVHDWQYSSAFHEYAQTKDGMNNRFVQYLRIADQAQKVRLLREESLTLQGAAVPCYVIELERTNRQPTPEETYWIDKSRYLVLKSTSSKTSRGADVPGGTTQHVMQVSRVATGAAIPDSLFEFTPPAGADSWTGSIPHRNRPSLASLSRNSSGPICRVIRSAQRVCPVTWR